FDLLPLALVLHAPGLEGLAVALALLGRGGVLHAVLGALAVLVHPPPVLLQGKAVAVGIGLARGLGALLARGLDLLARALPGLRTLGLVLGRPAVAVGRHRLGMRQRRQRRQRKQQDRGHRQDAL